MFTTMQMPSVTRMVNTQIRYFREEFVRTYSKQPLWAVNLKV